MGEPRAGRLHHRHQQELAMRNRAAAQGRAAEEVRHVLQAGAPRLIMSILRPTSGMVYSTPENNSRQD